MQPEKASAPFPPADACRALALLCGAVELPHAARTSAAPTASPAAASGGGADARRHVARVLWLSTTFPNIHLL
jgi:hypothetical protein